MENSPTKSEINCAEVVDKLGKVKALFTEYEVALSNPDIRDNLPASIKLSEEVEAVLLELEAILHPEYILEIDRSINLVDFIRKPQTEGGLGLLSQPDPENPIAGSDERNEGITEIDFSKVKLDMSWLPEGESSVDGGIRLASLMAKSNEFIRLDLFVLAALWKLLKGNEEQKKDFENKMSILAKVNGLKIEELYKYFISFDGTIVRNSGGTSFLIYLHCEGGWGWGAGRDSLQNGIDKSKPSLVLPI